MRSFFVQSARKIRGFVESPITKMVVGLVLLGTAIYEIEEGLIIEFQDEGPGAHHGIAAFGILTMIAALPDLIESFLLGAEFLENIEDGESGP